MAMNVEVRTAIKKAKLHHWEIAKYLEIGESTLSRWFREELTEDKKNMILKAIEELTK